MSESGRTEEGEARVREWVERTLGWGNGRADVVRVPHLGTPGFDFFVVSQRALGPAGDIFVMTDGREIHTAGPSGLGRVLAREGFPRDAGAIPAAQLAELFLRMGAVRQGRVIQEASDFALRSLSEAARASFTPPRIQPEGDGALLTFWTAGADPTQVARWKVWITADAALSHEVEPVV